MVRARRHVRRCPACADYFEQDRRLLELYDRLRGVRTPERVKERVIDMLGRESTDRSLAVSAADDDVSHGRSSSEAGRGTRLRRFGLGDFVSWRRLAAGALVAAAVGALLVVPGARDVVSTESSMFVEDYLRRAVSQDRISSSDPSEVSRFLARELGMGVTPLEVAGLDLDGAEICLLEGRRGAMIRYRSETGVVSHYVVPREGARIRAPTLVEPPAPGKTGTLSPAVVVWSDAKVEQALVAPLSPARLLGLARLAVSEE
ncbi:MAG: hypothetical protein GWM92_05925 [Gemmatimonadetes bacterium]|nr:hypothetical protein [Gemmatimonadota bacterium]NIT86704.1 hypothetical protein [Gemmatimonadota bacterium]NIU30563.1 hypothetical protein [Gemmatimonadota bacterium]NIU35401.1 hypothetical protein [Gemmatimonadota bacterium]NIV60930.1 hypothetical protein [Gemmatimonadota bacterium]